MTSYTLSPSTLSVRVLELLSFGLLVKLDDGRTGVIRKREIAWDGQERQRWREHFKPGDTLEVVQLSDAQHRIELSLRLAQKNPWNDVLTRYQVGQVVDGIVTGVQMNVAFVEIEAGVTGLLHRSRLPSWLPKAHISDVLWPGDHVRVMIELIHPGKRRLGLSISHAWSERWKTAPEQLSTQLAQSSAALQEKQMYLALDLLHEHSSRTILVVEDDHAQRDAVTKWLRQAGQRTLVASSAEQGLTTLEQERPDLVFMDVGLPGINGITAVKQILDQRSDLRFILMTDWASANQYRSELEHLSQVGVHLLLKPFLPEDLLDILSESADSGTETLKYLASPSVPIPVDTVSMPLTRKGRLQELIDHLASIVSGTKIILFKLDGAQRKISIVAEAGPGAIRRKVLIDLIYSPVRDVAEDRRTIQISDARYEEPLVRHLTPLLTFQSALGIPIPGDLPEGYALFLFNVQSYSLSHLHEAQARTTALAVGALFENEQLRLNSTDLQRLAMLGQMSRALVHEVNHRLNPINFALSDLRSQLAGIRRVVATATETLDRDVREADDTLADLTNNVHHLTETARLFSRMTTQRYEERLDPQMVVVDLIHLVRDMANQANITVELIAPSKPPLVRMQAAHVQQILLNIVINAIQQIELLRRQEGGRIQLRIVPFQHEHGNMLRIEVEDDGPGIHRRLWERIFELGFTTRQEGGSGLGLYITSSLIKSLGGRVWVMESRIGWGSILVVEFPIIN